MELLTEPQLHEDDRHITGSNIDPRCTGLLLKLLEDLLLRITHINRDLAIDVVDDKQENIMVEVLLLMSGFYLGSQLRQTR
jgi:hypothetical protein